MTVRFINWRLALYVAVFLFSGTVLGLAGHLANVFLPNLHKDFTIFALVVPCLTIFAFLLTYQWSQPRIEVAVLFTLGILWIAMGAWSADIIGHIQCDSLGGQRTATKMGDMSAQAYCYEMKVIQAFSWANFILFVLAFLIILKLISQAQGYGRWNIWAEPIEELGWFHEYPGWYSQSSGMQRPIPYAAMGGYPQMPMAQQPGGTTLLVQPNGNQPPTTARRSHAFHTLSAYVTNVLTSEMKWILPHVQHAFFSCSVSEKPHIPFNELPSLSSTSSSSMPLFQERPLRSTGALIIALAGGWFLTRILGSLPLHLTQTTVAILAILSLMYMVAMHHRREGQVMTQTQEEMILIGGFGLFWIAVLLAWRAYGGSRAGGGEMDHVGGGGGGESAGGWSYPCTSDDVYCIVEEWSFF